MDSRELSAKARALGGALEPVVGQVYFSPECHANYAALGFQPSPGDMNGVALPESVAYFTSRGSLMGQVSGEVVAAAFAVFNPLVVVPAMTAGWQITDAKTICAARRNGAISQLERIFVKGNDDCSEIVTKATRDSYKRLMAPSLENELLTAMKKKADELKAKLETIQVMVPQKTKTSKLQIT